MHDTCPTPFSSIESAHDYIGLLIESLDEAERTITGEIDDPGAFTRPRHLDALRLIDYKLKTLRHHLDTSRRALTDLRTLRRYLLDERRSGKGVVERHSTPGSRERQLPTVAA